MSENCLHCGLPESHQSHDRRNPPKEGWHPFRGLAYLEALEDALLFIREKKQSHQWEETGVILPMGEMSPIIDKRCRACGGNNWRGDDGICFGNGDAELAIIAAHNRRAARINS